jgi:hypothetical protein
MTFLAPAFLFAAGLVSAAVVAIHFIVTREPRIVPLPTARFAPERPVKARSRTLQLQDLLLLLLRVLLILAVGAALARPVLRPARRALARIVVVDRSRAVASGAEVADSALALFSSGDAVLLFDSAATVLRAGELDSLAALEPSSHTGRISTALVAALRTATEIRERADSFEIAIISPFAAEEIDYATDSVRALWPGRVRLVQVAARVDSAWNPVIAMDAPATDPLHLALPPRIRSGSGETNVRIVRGAATASDSSWVREGARVLLHWPASIANAHGAGALPQVWNARGAVDTVGAVSAGTVVVAAPLERQVVYRPDTVSMSADGRPPSRVVARWVDGEPAAVEEAHGSGCIRTVTVDVPARGDLVLQPRFGRLVAELAAPCGGAAALQPLDGPRLASLAGPESLGLVSGDAIAQPEVIPSPLVKWLLALGLLLALGELALRRRAAGAAGGEDQ